MRFLKNYILFFGVLCLFWTRFPGSSRAGTLDDVESQSKGVAHYTMALVYDLQGMTEEAIEEYRASADYQANSLVFLRLGADYARLGKLDEAIAVLGQALDADPNNIQARYLLALIYSSQKDFNHAADEYEKILTSFAEADPGNVEIYLSLGQLFFSQKNYAKAIDQYKMVLQLTPKDPDVIFLVGSLYLELGDRQQAIESFSQALQINPDHDGSLNSLGYLYAESGDKLNEAEDLVSRAIKIDPKNGAYWDSLGWVYYQKGEYEKALDTFKEADSFLKDPVIYEHLGDVYLKLHNSEEAKKYWSLSLEMLPGQEQVIKKIEQLN